MGVVDDPGVRLLSPDGERKPDAAYDPFLADLTGDHLLALHRDLVLTRRFDAEATAMQRQGELALWPSSLGQEAVAIAAGRAMAPGDHAFTTYREHGLALTRGVAPIEILSMFRGVTHGGWDPAVSHVAPYTIVIGNQVPIAVGFAMGNALDASRLGSSDQTDAVIACFGDGASSEGDVHEGMVFASAFRAPVVFLCTNNQWAISVPVGRQSTAPLHLRGTAYAIPSVRVDGNDILAMLAVMRSSLAAAHDGHGPAFVEAWTYRRGAHTTSDDPTRYRSADELAEWEALDPLLRYERYLEGEGLLDERHAAAVAAEAETMAVGLRDAVRALPEPPPDAMFTHAYTGEHQQVAVDREALASYLAGFADVEATPGGQP